MDRIDAPWLHNPALKDITDTLGADNVRFVGGVVRDTLAGRPVKDIDIATKWLPEEARDKLQTAGLKVIPTGLQHGTITALAAGEPVEITTLRQDVSTDGRHAEVAFTSDWHVDASRRDFTINALYAAPDGALFDPFDGVADLRAGRVRFIGDATARIKEDALRIMRFFRFHAGYGRGDPDEDGLRAATDCLPMLERLSVERIRDEILKLLAYADPLPTLRVMRHAGLWRFTPLRELDLTSFDRLRRGEQQLGFTSSAYARMATLAGRSAQDIKPVCRALKMSKAEETRICRISRAAEAAVPECAKDIRNLVYFFGAEAVRTVVATAAPARQDLYALIDEWAVPSFPLKGRDIIAAGVEAGPEISRLLKELEAAWIASDFTLGRDELLTCLAKRLT